MKHFLLMRWNLPSALHYSSLAIVAGSLLVVSLLNLGLLKAGYKLRS